MGSEMCIRDRVLEPRTVGAAAAQHEPEQCDERRDEKTGGEQIPQGVALVEIAPSASARVDSTGREVPADRFAPSANGSTSSIPPVTGRPEPGP